MALEIIVPVSCGALMLFGIILKVFKDHDMTLRDGATLAVLLGIVLYCQLASASRFNGSLALVSMICTICIVLILGNNIVAKINKRLLEKIRGQRARH
jgi:hypothetical protein